MLNYYFLMVGLVEHIAVSYYNIEIHICRAVEYNQHSENK